MKSYLRRSVSKKNTALDAQVYMEREQNENSPAERNAHIEFFMHVFVVAQKRNGSGEKQSAQDMQWDQEPALTNADPRRFEFDDTKETDNNKSHSESIQRINHSFHTIAGARS